MEEVKRNFKAKGLSVYTVDKVIILSCWCAIIRRHFVREGKKNGKKNRRVLERARH